MPEFWNSPKLRVLRGSIVTAGVPAACDIHNPSRSGATLRLPKADGLPSAFVLDVDNHSSVACSVVRRSRFEVVVRFDRL